MQAKSDIGIIQSIKAGNNSDFAILIDRYQDKAYRLCLGVLKNEEDAKEALHLSFIKAYENLGRYGRKAKFSTWFFRICYNQCMTMLRYSGKFNRNMSPEDHPDLSPSELNNGIEFLALDEQRKYINLALEKLKLREAFLIKAYYLDEIDLKELVVITGMNMSNIKVTLFRARKKMLSQLELLLKEEVFTLMEKP